MLKAGLLLTKNCLSSYKSICTQFLELLFIFINGVITGVVKNSLTEGTFQIKDAKIIFNSNNCDISLYKLRVYNEFLNIVDICMNYGVDRKDVVIYD